MPKIIIHHADGTSVKYGLNGPSFTIGRAEGNDIILPAGAASSHHAVLKLNETGDFTVTDLESTNKTKVNGRAMADHAAPPAAGAAQMPAAGYAAQGDHCGRVGRAKAAHAYAGVNQRIAGVQAE